MSESLARAQALYDRRRYDLAARELRRLLEDDPDDGRALTLLADCLALLDNPAEARAISERALELTPDSAMTWRVRANVLNISHQFGAGEDAATSAIEIDPRHPSGFEIRARSRTNLGHLQGALEDVDQALAIRPGSASVLALRGLILTKLGRREEAAEATATALELDPESVAAHATLGWQHLHRGDAAQALPELREALRIDPRNRYAQAGLVQALKARNPVYSGVLRAMLWASHNRRAGTWMFLGGALLARLLLVTAISDPVLRPLAIGAATLWFGLVMLMWTASPLFSFVAWLSPEGRHVIDRTEAYAGAAVAAAGGAALALVPVWIVTGDRLWAVAAVGTLCNALGVVAAFRAPAGWRRQATRVLMVTAPIVELLGIGAALAGAAQRDANGLPSGWAMVAVLSPLFLGILARLIASGPHARLQFPAQLAWGMLGKRWRARVLTSGRRTMLVLGLVVGFTLLGGLGDPGSTGILVAMALVYTGLWSFPLARRELAALGRLHGRPVSVRSLAMPLLICAALVSALVALITDDEVPLGACVLFLYLIPAAAPLVGVRSGHPRALTAWLTLWVSVVVVAAAGDAVSGATAGASAQLTGAGATWAGVGLFMLFVTPLAWVLPRPRRMLLRRRRSQLT